MVRQLEVESLVQNEGSRVNRSIFIDQDIYDMEMERIFARNWLFLGHESQVENKGDFFTTYMGEDPILVTRDNTGKVNAFLNACLHRGMRVCRADRGNSVAFTCSYHAWTYANNGSLIGVPLHKEAYYGDLDRSKFGLAKVPRLENYKGLLFGSFNLDAPPLVEYLGDMTWYLDCILDRRDGGTEVIGGIQKWETPSNWKFFCDNHIGDWYHVPFTHGSAQRARGGSSRPPATVEIRPRDGFGLGGWYLSEDAPIEHYGPAPREDLAVDLPLYFQSTLPEVKERLGPVRSRVIVSNGNVWPNMAFVPGSNTIRIAHPRGPQKIEVWSWCIVDKAASPEVKNAIKQNYIRSFGPGGLLEQDDGENWEQCTRSARGWMARQQFMDYSMGMGHEWYNDELKGAIGKAQSEGNQRGLYRRWASDMSKG
jgi:phenylpropionate dioxygenase-like ring-hydroxylating dioxygenase large terminal subunit